MRLEMSDLHGCTESQLRGLVGHKAAELCRFARVGETIDAKVPRFALVPATFLDEAEPAAWPQVPMRYPQLPSVETIPAGVREAAVLLAAHAHERGVLDGLPGGRAVLRSSLVWPDDRTRRPAGVDTHGFLCGAQDGHTVLPGVLAGLYKAYTSFFLDLAGLDATATRACGLILMELLTVRAEGTAYLVGDRTVVESATTGRDFVRATSSHSLTETSCLSTRVTRELTAVLAALRPDASSRCLVEVEFLVDAHDELYFVQRRELPIDADQHGNPAVFSSVGEFTGPVVEVRGQARATITAVQVAGLLEGASGRAVIVPLKDQAAVDAFTLAWVHRRHGVTNAPGAIVVTHDTATQTGMKTHLKWTLRAAFPATPVFAVVDHEIPRGIREVSLVSDGVTVRSRRGAGT